MQVNQILPALSYGDAVSNHAIEIKKILNENGYNSNIYAKYIDSAVSQFAKPLSDYREDPVNVVIYHFALAGLDVTEFVKKLPEQKVLIYHNITPAEYFRDIDDTLYHLCLRGRDEFRDLSAYIQLGLGISRYNEMEMIDVGYKETDILPIIINLERFGQESHRGFHPNQNERIINIIFVGRLSPNKKQEDIVKVFHIYNKFINSSSHLYLVGSEQIYSYASEITTLLKFLELEEHVTITGKVDDRDLSKYYKLADIFLCMSEHEGFCVPLIEAMHFGIPILAYNSSAIPYTLGNAGILINNKNYIEIAEMIDLLIKDATLCRRVVETQNERLKDFKRERVAKQLIATLENFNNRISDTFISQKISNSNHPLVSVVVCTYNRALYLDRCIQSLINQSYSNMEIIIVNGPSTDNTEDILSKYPGITVIHQKKLNGLSAARNLGIKESGGEIIAFIDDDAVADKDWVRYLLDGYENDLIAGVGGPVFDITGNWYQFRNGYVSKLGIPTFINNVCQDYNNPNGHLFNYIMGTNSSFRKALLFNINLFDENIKYYLDETDVCIRLIKQGYKIRHYEPPIVFHEMAEGHNRSSPYDLNYKEIMKNIIYFTIKNFKSDLSSYTISPCRSLFYWMRITMGNFMNNDITLNQICMIYLKLVEGMIIGYKEGIAENIKCGLGD
jgi:glycosyltransferase involved in cell wall biosynthesis